MSFSVKSLDWTVCSQSAMKVSLRTQATTGQGSIAGKRHTCSSLIGPIPKKAPAQEKGNTVMFRRDTFRLIDSKFNLHNLIYREKIADLYTQIHRGK